MKTTATLIQQALEQKAIDSMIAYERNLISEQKMGKALMTHCSTIATSKDTAALSSKDGL